MGNPRTDLDRSIFKIYPEPDHFSPPPLMPLWPSYHHLSPGSLLWPPTTSPAFTLVPHNLFPKLMSGPPVALISLMLTYKPPPGPAANLSPHYLLDLFYYFPPYSHCCVSLASLLLLGEARSTLTSSPLLLLSLLRRACTQISTKELFATPPQVSVRSSLMTLFNFCNTT